MRRQGRVFGSAEPFRLCGDGEVVVLVLNNTTEPKGWRRLCVGADRGVNLVNTSR